jgi:hypothetical protein
MSETAPGLRSYLRCLVLALATAAGCIGSEPPARTSRESAPAPAISQPGRSAQAVHANRYDLEGDEAIGGHTIGRHVGKSDSELAERLRRETQINTASTYTDLGTAERVVAAALASNRGRLREWSSRTGPRPNLVLTYRGDRGAVIGRSLARGARRATSCSAARVVIRWHDRAQRWIVLTSYPEPQ